MLRRRRRRRKRASLETLLRDMQDASRKAGPFRRLKVACAFVHESAAELAEAEKALRAFAAMEGVNLTPLDVMIARAGSSVRPGRPLGGNLYPIRGGGCARNLMFVTRLIGWRTNMTN